MASGPGGGSADRRAISAQHVGSSRLAFRLVAPAAVRVPPVKQPTLQRRRIEERVSHRSRNEKQRRTYRQSVCRSRPPGQITHSGMVTPDPAISRRRSAPACLAGAGGRAPDGATSGERLRRRGSPIRQHEFGEELATPRLQFPVAGSGTRGSRPCTRGPRGSCGTAGSPAGPCRRAAPDRGSCRGSS